MPQRNHTVVVGVDGSPASIAALRWAVEEARLREGEVHAVHAWMPPQDWQVAPVLPPDLEELEQAARRQLDDALATVTGRVRRSLIEGDARAVLVTAANDADLLVVGSHGRNTLVRALIGSVSTYCIHHAACPVVVVRERPDSRDGAVVGP